MPLPAEGIAHKTRNPSAPIANSIAAYMRSGWNRAGATRGKRRLPTHIPPINVARRIASERAVDPMESSRSWNQTIS